MLHTLALEISVQSWKLPVSSTARDFCSKLDMN